jgi:hypothetical protein
MRLWELLGDPKGQEPKVAGYVAKPVTEAQDKKKGLQSPLLVSLR